MERDLSTALQRAIEAGDQVLTAEVMPPRGADPSHMLAMAASLQGRVHAVNVTDGSRAVMRMSSLASCKLLLEAGLEPVLQMACRDRNRIALQADLLGAHALGIRNLLCLTGDPVRAGDQAYARSVNEFESVKLLQQVDALNRGGFGSRAGHPARWGDHAVCRVCRRPTIEELERSPAPVAAQAGGGSPLRSNPDGDGP